MPIYEIIFRLKDNQTRTEFWEAPNYESVGKAANKFASDNSFKVIKIKYKFTVTKHISQFNR